MELKGPTAAPRIGNKAGEVNGVVYDVDSRTPLAGATVIIQRDGSSHRDAFITDHAGVYHVRKLPAGVYTLKFYYVALMVPATGVTVKLGHTTTVDAHLDTASQKSPLPPEVDARAASK